jgi:hypothetical protein
VYWSDINIRSKFLFAIAAAGLVCLMMPGSALAEESYTYSGQTLGPDPPNSFPYTSSDSVQGSFTVSTALADNLPLTDITTQVESLSFTDGINTYTQSSSFSSEDFQAEAVPHCDAAVAIYGGMAAAASGNVQASEDLASAESVLSLALERADSLRQALEAQQRARRLFVAALAHDPDSLDLAEDNAKSLIELSTIQQQLKAADGARETAEEARNTLRSLTERFPQSRTFAVLLKQAEELR